MGKFNASGVAAVFNFSVGSDGPPPRTWVYPMVELMTNGTAHAVPWSRLPSIGPFYDWNEALAQAVRVEWCRADGQLVCKYIQVLISMRQAAPDQGVPLKVYAMAVAIVRFLKQQTFEEKMPRPQWQPDFGVARLKEQTLSCRNVSTISCGECCISDGAFCQILRKRWCGNRTGTGYRYHRHPIRR
jgi:hypothetical protein